MDEIRSRRLPPACLTLEITETAAADLTSAVKRLGLVAVAEGVETQELARDMAGLGYGVLQGYFAARPMPADELFGFARGETNERTSGVLDFTHP